MTTTSGSDGPTATWGEFESDAPELAEAVKARFTATRHHVLASLRRTGAPRVSGTEVQFVGGQLVFGTGSGARKAVDLAADARMALHANPGDGSMAGGDAKLSGLAVPLQGDEAVAVVGEQHAAEGAVAFAVGLTDVVHTALHPDGDRLVVTLWRPGRGVTTADVY